MDKAAREQELMRRLAEKRKARLAAAKDNYDQDRTKLAEEKAEAAPKRPSIDPESNPWNIMKAFVMQNVVQQDADEEQQIVQLKEA